MNKNENKFDIQCFGCKKQYQNDGIPKRCKHCQSRNIEAKHNGSIIDFDNSLTFTWDTCEECGKFKNIKSSDATSEELENKIKELKNEDNYCEGNCQQQSTYSQTQSNSSILSNQQNSQTAEREREREQLQI